MLDRKVIRVSLTDFFLAVVCLFPFAMIMGDEGIVNKLLFALLAGLIVGMLFDRPVKKRTIVLLLVLALNYVYTFFGTVFPLKNPNMMFYFVFYMVYTYFMCDNQEGVIRWFGKHKGFIALVLAIWNIVVGISIFLPSCYYVKEGGNSYFGSFAASIFRLGQSTMFIQVLIIVAQVLHGKRNAFFYNIIPMYCYLMGSSRTYLIVGVCLFMVSWYLYCPKKKTFYGSLLPMAALLVLLISTSSMGDKIAHTLDDSRYGDFWFRVTSSRDVLWEENLTAWGKTPLINKLLGNGLGFTFEVTGLWAHNDFIEILCSFGLAGLAQYLYSIGHLFMDGGKKSRMPFVVGFFTLVAWFANAFLNMHFVYFCAALCYPILVLSVKHYYTQLSEKNELQRQKNIANAGDQINEKGPIYFQH